MRLHQKEHGTPNNSIVLYQGKLLCISFHLGIHHLLVIPFHQTSGESFSYRTAASSSTAAPSSPGTETIASRVRRKKEQQSSLVVHTSLNKLTNAIVGRQRKSCDVRSNRDAEGYVRCSLASVSWDRCHCGVAISSGIQTTAYLSRASQSSTKMIFTIHEMYELMLILYWVDKYLLCPACAKEIRLGLSLSSVEGFLSPSQMSLRSTFVVSVV